MYLGVRDTTLNAGVKASPLPMGFMDYVVKDFKVLEGGWVEEIDLIGSDEEMGTSHSTDVEMITSSSSYASKESEEPSCWGSSKEAWLERQQDEREHRSCT